MSFAILQLLEYSEVAAEDFNKTKEDFSPVKRPWLIGKKRLLNVLKNKTNLKP